MRRIRTAAARTLETVLYLIALFFWTMNKGVILLAAVGLVSLLGKPAPYPALLAVVAGALIALDTVAWFLDRESQLREQTEA